MALPPLNEEIQQLSLYNLRPIVLHGYVAPFLVLYTGWLYVWMAIYGVEDYYEAGLIALAIIGLLQILTCLFCHWFVDVRTLLTCTKVRKVLYCVKISLCTHIRPVPTQDQ